jgi:hypothetical protein
MLSEDTRLVDKLWGNVDYLNKVYTVSEQVKWVGGWVGESVRQ